MTRWLWIFGRIFAPRWYHRQVILARYPKLRELLEPKRPQSKPAGGSSQQNKPAGDASQQDEPTDDSSLYLLLLGSVQPSDFVLQWTASRVGQETISLQESYRHFKTTQKDFKIAVLKESLKLHIELEVVTDLYRVKTTIIAMLVLGTVLLGALSLIFYPNGNPLMLLSDFTFASVLLVPPILGLFAYSQIMRATFNRREALQLQLTRLSSATHAFNTMDQVKRMQLRLEQKSQLDTRRKTVKTEEDEEDRRSQPD